MTSHLPPHLEQFVQEQIAIGRFHSEGELIREALQLFQKQFLPHHASAPWPEQEFDQGLRSRPAPRADGRRSPRGILADLRSDLNFDEFREARSEMWSGFQNGPGE
jgi:Arc/MetJ-type ribon-helix-helix transcriptional regulator